MRGKKLTKFQKKIRDLAGTQIEAKLTNHADLRFRQRMNMTRANMRENFGKQSIVKLTIPIIFSDIHLYRDELKIISGRRAFEIRNGKHSFWIGECRKNPNHWDVITYYCRK